MSGKLSLSELTKLYSASNKPPSAIETSTSLPGSSTLDKLSKLFFSRESSKLFAAASTKGQTVIPPLGRPAIAVCLVIVDELFHEAIWKEWVEQGVSATSRYEARLFIHAKNPERIESPWVQSCLLQGETFKPEWNSPEVIRAMLACLKEAIDHGFGAGRFVFGTESCIPIHPLEHVGDCLFAEDVSWLNAFDTGKSNWETGACFLAVDPTLIPPRAVWKTIPGWMMLNRRHAAEILNLLTCVGDDLVRAWGPGGQWKDGKGVFAPEEVFFSTMLAILGYLRKGGGGSGAAGGTALDQVRRRMVTHATWARTGEANPITYSRLSSTVLDECRQGGCLFARKFARNSVSLADWRALVCPSIDSAVCESASASALAPSQPVNRKRPRPEKGDETQEKSDGEKDLPSGI